MSVPNLTQALAVLIDALELSGRATGWAGGTSAAVHLTEAQCDAVLTLLAGEVEMGGIHRAALAHCTRNDLLGWINMLSHRVAENAAGCPKAQAEKNSLKNGKLTANSWRDRAEAGQLSALDIAILLDKISLLSGHATQRVTLTRAGIDQPQSRPNPLHGLSRDAVVILTHVDACKERKKWVEQRADVWIECNGLSALLRKNPVGPVAQGSLEEVMRYVSEALSLSAPVAVASHPAAQLTTAAPSDHPLKGGAGLGVGGVDAKDAKDAESLNRPHVHPVHLFLYRAAADADEILHFADEILHLNDVCRNQFRRSAVVGGARAPEVAKAWGKRIFASALCVHGPVGLTFLTLPEETLRLAQVAEVVIINDQVVKDQAGTVGWSVVVQAQAEGCSGDAAELA